MRRLFVCKDDLVFLVPLEALPLGLLAAGLVAGGVFAAQQDDFPITVRRANRCATQTSSSGSRRWPSRRHGARSSTASILVPAFVTSELKTAFQIGFLIFIPFVVIDLVVASTLMSMGMMMLSPMLVSLPFKIMLFVLVDGWTLLMSTLAGSFYL